MKPSNLAVALGVLILAVSGILFMLVILRQPRTVTATFDPPYPQFNVRGDPIRAVMEGRIACPVAGCEKLKVTLVLYETAQHRNPSTYWLAVVGTRGSERVVTQGTWGLRHSVEGFPDALVYALDSDGGIGLRNFWRVNDNILLLLDDQMRPRPGNSAWGNMLSRYDAPYGPLTYTWAR